MKKLIPVICISLFFMASAQAEKGRYVYLGSGCSSCHGVDGKGIVGKGADVSGKPENELFATIKRFNASQGQHNQSMSSSDACDVPLSDKDIEAIAKWLTNA